MRAVDITGQTFHYLTAIKPIGSSKGSGVIWECLCKCGKTTNVTTKSLRRGNTKSCGCLNSERVIARNKAGALHGMTKTRTWISWDSMIQRCTNPEHKSFDNYGGRGIKVHPAWLDEFSTFYKDMGERPAGTTLDRINSAGDYEPGNCRWATPQEQGNNRRNNISLTVGGVTDTLANWSRKTGIGQKTIMYRIKHGWSDEQTLSVTPSKANKLEKL